MTGRREDFIAAIRAAPNDDDLRLVFADWLEDQGDEAGVARAEFIRLQVRRARLPLSDPLHSELQARELRLLRRYAPVWCGEHFVFKKATFRRGFVERVHLHLQHFLHHRRQMLALEPVREIRLTGWHRPRGPEALAHLVRRVAGCEEWQGIETLEIHHQGPHKEPKADVLTLLESPHLSRLRDLRCPRLALTADERRRFERLPLLGRLERFRLPPLEEWPHRPGAWFSDGGAVPAWEGLTSFEMGWLGVEAVRRVLEMPFWSGLTSLAVAREYGQDAELVRLDERLPESLRELRLYGELRDEPGNAGLLDRLRRMPLRRLHLEVTQLGPGILAGLLDDSGHATPEGLRLRPSLSEGLARALIESGSLGALHTLALGLGPSTGAARVLFRADCLPTLRHLDLSGAGLGPDALRLLAQAKRWDRLRVLKLALRGVTAKQLLALLASPTVQSLVALTLVDRTGRTRPGLEVGVDVARALTRLPHLARLELTVRACDPQARRILAESPSLAWPTVECYDDEDDQDIATYRASRSPERTPPVDLE